jgi:hypothetical protein
MTAIKFSRVRKIMLRDWHPIIIGDNPNLSDEYDHYIPGIVSLPDTHCKVGQLEAIFTELSWTVSGNALKSVRL